MVSISVMRFSVCYSDTIPRMNFPFHIHFAFLVDEVDMLPIASF